MKKVLCIAVLFLFSMLIIPVEGRTADPAQQNPVWTNTNNLKNVKPIPAQPTQKSRAVSSENEKQLPSIEFQSIKTERLSTGEWRWDVHIKATQNRQVAPNTARVRVWQNAGGKKRLLATRTYDRPINPGYGYLVDAFFPSGESDTLDFELIELNPSSSGLTSNQDANNVVDRASSGVPPFGITMTKYGYSYIQEPAYLYCLLKNDSAFPMKIQVVMRGGEQSSWTTLRHREVVVVKSGETMKVQKFWTHTEKGYAYFRISAEVQLLDPNTGNVSWTEIIGNKGILPTLR